MTAARILFFLLLCGVLHSQTKPEKFAGGFSFGFGYSGLQYSISPGNHINSYPAKFTAAFPDDTGNVLSGQFVFPKKKVIGGFTAHFEWLLFRTKNKKLLHGPDLFVSYQKSNLIEANMWGPGYLVRRNFKNSKSGLLFAARIFPANKFMIELDSLSTNKGNYYFRGEYFGDTCRAIFTEVKTSLCTELTFIWASKKNFEMRFSAGGFFVLKSRQYTRIIPELRYPTHDVKGNIYSPSGEPAKLPLLTPGYIYFRAGIYLFTVN